MESGIVEGFQNLHVLPDSIAANSLTLDLAVALEESSPRLLRKAARCIDVPVGGGPGQPNTSRYPVRKRRFKKRKSAAPVSVSGFSAAANVSDGLDSSTSESPARHDYMDTVTRLSDSDDMALSKGSGTGLPRTSVPSAAQFAESDSVTENWTPLRPQRRRKHFRRMAVDVQATTHSCSGSRSGVSDVTGLCGGCAPATSGTLDAYHGKRKRGVKDKSDASLFEHDVRDYGAQSSSKTMDSALSSSVSSESEIGGNSNDDAVDGDDEQSDFYCEPDYPCARGIMAASMIAGARSRWKADHCRHLASDSYFDRLHHDACGQMSSSLRNSYKARCKILFGREFHSGRRRIKDRAHPPYSYSCFLQERHGWNSSNIQRHAGVWNQLVTSAVGGSTEGGGGKRHRMMITSEQFSDIVDKHAAAISSAETQLDSRLRFPAASGVASAFDSSVGTFSTDPVIQLSW